MKRIDFIASLTKGYDTVIDIGTDHGLVLKKAFKKGYIKKAIAADLRERPLESAKNNLKDYEVKFYLTDGFKNIKEEYDLAIICGMGSHTILDILSHASDHTKHFLLGANDKHEHLRENLMKQGFKIIDEHVIFDKFYYVFIKVTKGNMSLTKEDLFLGPILKTKPESKKYYQHLLKYYQEIYPKVDEDKKSDFEFKLKCLEKRA